ncbi:reverse transcriptase domain-containing protein, partial [Enterobacter cloacae complex sp. 2DZ2F20B]|uniref:reverse transcriptase domain-containing protein n=1 Tax=Enterobacter cloacae complex sp. 2DZ2F20B TaxID=2511993 RepID=UPI00101347D3
GYKSKYYVATSGVPQGSILGPLLFLIYINDAIEVITNSQVLMFADDIKIFREIANVNDSVLLQNDVNKFRSWCTSNCLSINTDKCKIMTFSLCKNIFLYDYNFQGMVIERVTSIKDLGICYDSEMNFKQHVCNIVN